MPSTRALLRIALAALVLAVFAHTRADPDLWGHVLFGRDLVAAHGARVADTYSFDSDRPWVNHEWLAEVVMYLAFASLGGAGLIVLKVLLLVVMTAAVSIAIRAGPLAGSTHDLLIGLLLVGTVPQASHVRPQLFSLALFACLLAVLMMSGRRRALLIAVPPLMTVWANLHGGWIVGAGTLVAWAISQICFGTVARRDKVVAAAVAVTGALATLANPEGWRLWAFLRETVHVDRADIVDWQPVFRLGPAYALIWLLVLAAALIAVLVALRRHVVLNPGEVAVVAMLGIGSFRVNRLLAFFTIAVVMLLRDQLSVALASWNRREERQSAVRSAVAVSLGLAVLAGSTVVAARNATCIRMDATEFPEPSLVEQVRGAGLRGRMLTWFAWGEYAIWHFAPSIKVSMDGRRETVYTDAAVQRHLRFYFLPAERQPILDALDPDYIWLPASLPVTNRLEADGWQLVFAGTESVLLARKPVVKMSTPQQPGSPAGRCFPGP